MKLQFDKNQPYQLEAIQSVIGLFEGQPRNTSENDLVLTEEELLTNLVRIQTLNQLRNDEVSLVIEKLWYNENEATTGIVPGETVATSFPNYSVEMETGTGKTYVYLRTIYELNKAYGFRKFVIVVPSVAIREGVLKSLQITYDHFQEIYQNQPVEFKHYDANKLTELRNFAIGNAIQILVINIDSFTKHVNVINQLRETGIKPIEYIQQSKPVVILDEPQNMETGIRKKAIANLNPLFTLRYSATHKNLYNLVYKLDPVKAYDLGLVKQIEVDSVTVKNDGTGAFIAVDGFRMNKKSIAANLTIFINEKSGVQKKQVSAGVGDDLFQLSKGCEMYKDGYVINGIDSHNGFIEFSGRHIVHKKQAVGGLTDEVLKAMIDATVENHFKKEKVLRGKGIKVLSIFFIDRVANYRTYDEKGHPVKGKFAVWFEESFTKWQNTPGYDHLFSESPQEVHNGYFSQGQGKYKDSKEGKPAKADDETFQLIMRDKEKLLDIAVPLRFIFSHSALREGWDNQNVFQICTLNETKSAIKKRQEIGRGLRLCVDQAGVRNFDREVNRLTIIANEAYESFSKALQTEIEDDCGVVFEGRIRNARETIKLEGKSQEKIKRTRYDISYSTGQLIDNCIAALQHMPFTEKPVIFKEKNIAKFVRDDKGKLVELAGEQQNSQEILIKDTKYDIPDLPAYIQSKTGLTRDTITKILLNCDRLGEIFNNPQSLMDNVVKVVQHELEKIKNSHLITACPPSFQPTDKTSMSF